MPRNPLIGQSITLAALSFSMLATACTEEPLSPGRAGPPPASFARQGSSAGATVAQGDLTLSAADAPSLASTCASMPFTQNAWAVAFGKSGCLIVSPLWASSAYPAYTLTDDIVLNVRLEKGKNGRITHVRLYGQDVDGEAGVAHQTDWIPVADPVVPTSRGFTLRVHARNVEVWRLDSHLAGGNRVDMIGTVSIGDVVYPPQS